MTTYPSLTAVVALPFIGVIGKGRRAAIWAQRLLPVDASATAVSSATVSIASTRSAGVSRPASPEVQQRRTE
ncbi:hypothetical protein [Amorphus sp. 3PC139-8]|uniref:hypothetical protein n=1 Tax=Amorphus sp. 3PC139-8 TaxID=2735676 RepID=UPI00345D1ED9